MGKTLNVTAKDNQWMEQCVALAEKGRYLSSPGPNTACLIVREEQVIAESYQGEMGTHPPEILALQKIDFQGEGTQLYCLLEPSLKAVEAITRAQVKCVYIACLQTSSQLQGVAIKRLQKAGVQVVSGVKGDLAQSLLKAYLWTQKTGTPYTLARASISLDGKRALPGGGKIDLESRASKRELHKLRAESGAILIGVKTAQVDKPQLTVRDYKVDLKQPPLRVVIDKHAQTEAIGPLFNKELGPTLIFTAALPSQPYVVKWRSAGCEVVHYNSEEEELAFVLKNLAERGIVQVLVEGGGELASQFFKQGLVNELVVHTAPLFLGRDAKDFFDLDIQTAAFKPLYSQIYDQTLCTHYQVKE